jgi:hypothetical protein
MVRVLGMSAAGERIYRRGDAAAVKPARQACPDWNIAPQPNFARVDEDLAE